MNFYGHAHVAAWESDDPRVLLGAMLPDFAAMCGAKLDAADVEVARGVELHHRSDAGFHASPTFRRLCVDGARELGALGVGRGPSRGAAHAGVEILLDGVLADGDPAFSLYRAALAVELATPPPELEELRRRLAASADAGGARDWLDPEVASRRLCHALARRPLLTPTEAERPRIAHWMRMVAPRVAAAAPQLMADVRAWLRDAGTSSGPPPR